MEAGARIKAKSLGPQPIDWYCFHIKHVYSPPARGLLMHCWCLNADADAGVECCWKPAGRAMGAGGWELGHELRNTGSRNNGSRRPTGWLPIKPTKHAHHQSPQNQDHHRSPKPKLTTKGPQESQAIRVQSQPLKPTTNSDY